MAAVGASTLVVGMVVQGGIQTASAATYYACVKPDSDIRQATIRLNTPPINCDKNDTIVSWTSGATPETR